ncbi:MAG: hypothetical protein ACRDRV_17215 [Pseudonocardiaceae bacterium]
MTMRPAAVRGHTIAMVRHYRAGEMHAVGSLLGDLAEPQDAGAAIASLVQLVSRVLDDRPDDAEAWLQDALRSLALEDGTS